MTVFVHGQVGRRTARLVKPWRSAERLTRWDPTMKRLSTAIPTCLPSPGASDRSLLFQLFLPRLRRRYRNSDKRMTAKIRTRTGMPYSDRCESYCCSGVHFRLPGHRTIRSSSAATGISISSTIDQKPRKGNKAAAKPLWFSLSLIFWPCPGKFRSLQIRNRSELTNSSDASRVAFGALYFLWQVPNRQDRRNRFCQFC